MTVQTQPRRRRTLKIVTVHGQELSPTNYAICQADLLIKDDKQAKVSLGNSLIPHDAHGKEPGDQFPEAKFSFTSAQQSTFRSHLGRKAATKRKRGNWRRLATRQACRA